MVGVEAPRSSARWGAGLEPFVVAMALAMVAATAVLTRLGWRHLRARQISPSDSPIQVVE
jgi:hypothetical protein